jgi:DNA polymerase I
MKNKYKEIFESISNVKREYNEHILLIDGLNTFLRNFTMINHVNPLGSHIGGLTGFLKSIGYAIKLTNPTRVLILFDGIGGSASRRNLYQGYKANRSINRMTNFDIFSSKEEESDSINDQMGRLIQYLQCLPIGMLSIDGLEADDLIGYVTNYFENEINCKKMTIMSADKDFLQLVSNKTEVYSPVKKIFYNKNKVLEDFNVSANNFIIMKTLLGDSSDNIPGVPGLGPKKLIKNFPEIQNDDIITFENIIEKSLKNGSGMYKNILESFQQLEINFKLMNLKEIPVSRENENILLNFIDKKPNPLYNQGFLLLYYKDQLGESIPYVEKWLNEVFTSLNLFK